MVWGKDGGDGGRSALRKSSYKPQNKDKEVNLKSLSLSIRGVMWFCSARHDQKKKLSGRRGVGGYQCYRGKETGLMMSRGTYLRSTVSFWASSAQLRRRVLNLDAACLSVPAATGGNALINTDCPSPSACRSVSLMILGGALPSLLLPEEPID